jgi:GlpG protein
MLYMLGTALERALSWWYLLLLVLVSAAFSNLLQLYMVSPFFGGMSGVVYALFGYIWIRGRYDPSFPYRMPKQIVTYLLFWLVLGFTGFMNMANGAHAGGLVVGVVWGLVASGYLKRRLGRWR